MTGAIIYPWKEEAASWDELRYSLRSVEKYFADRDCPIYVLSNQRPRWIAPDGRIRYLRAKLYATAVALGVQVAERCLWMNDDIALLKLCSWEDFEVPRCLGEMSRQEREDYHWHPHNSWRHGVARAMDALEHRARGCVNGETHTPYVWEQTRALEVLRTYGCWQKMPMATLYLNHHGIPAVPLDGFRTSSFEEGATVLNYTDRFLTEEFTQQLQERFPEPAPWELDRPAN